MFTLLIHITYVASAWYYDAHFCSKIGELRSKLTNVLNHFGMGWTWQFQLASVVIKRGWLENPCSWKWIEPLHNEHTKILSIATFDCRRLLHCYWYDDTLSYGILYCSSLHASMVRWRQRLLCLGGLMEPWGMLCLYCGFSMPRTYSQCRLQDVIIRYETSPA